MTEPQGPAAEIDAGTGEQEEGMEPPRTARPPAEDYTEFDRIVDGQPTALGES